MPTTNRTCTPLFRHTALVALLGVGSLALARPAFAQEAPKCTTTTTTTTTCTGQFAPLAAPAPELPPPVVAAPPVPVYTPAPLPVYNPMPLLPQPTLRYEERPRYGLFAAGLSVLAGVYFWNITAAVIVNDARPAIPIVGPLTMLDNRNGSVGNYFLVLDALVQAGGAAMMIVGLASKKKVAVYDQPKISFAPTATSSSAGFALSGRF
jgi:hypothetical protein